MIELILIVALGLGIGSAFEGNKTRSLDAAKSRAEYREAMKHQQERGR